MVHRQDVATFRTIDLARAALAECGNLGTPVTCKVYYRTSEPRGDSVRQIVVEKLLYIEPPAQLLDTLLDLRRQFRHITHVTLRYNNRQESDAQK